MNKRQYAWVIAVIGFVVATVVVLCGRQDSPEHGEYGDRMRLHDAVRREPVSKVEEIVVTLDKSELERRDLAGRTALALAAELGRADVVEVLLKAGSDLMARDGYGQTPLHLVAQKLHNPYFPEVGGHIAVARLLLEHGASCIVEDHDGRTPIDVARSFHRGDLVQLYEEAYPAGEDTIKPAP